MKKTASRQNLGRCLVPLVCCLLCSIGVVRMPAADDWDPLSGQKAGTDANGMDTGTAPAKAAEGDDLENPAPAATPIPSLTSTDDMLEPDEQAPLPKPSPAQEGVSPEVQIQPPLPGSETTEEAANSVPLPANPPLQQQFSEWDLAQIESPMFLNSAIDEFNQRPILSSGAWSVVPHLSIGTFYDGNIFLSSDNEQSDFITRFSPGFTVRLGDTDSMFYLVGDYTLGYNYYTEHPSESTLDQDGRIQAQWSLPKTTIGLAISASQDTGQDVDIGNRIRQEFYFAGLTAHYDFSEKTSWDVSADYTRSDFNGLISSRQAEGQVFFNYQYSPKTQFGVGTGAGVLMVLDSPQQTFEDASARATYRATGKVTLIAESGVELRQYGDGEGSTYTPVFLIESAWAPREGTSVSLDARRSIYASALLVNEDYTATSLDLTASQRITDYVNVSLATGYVNSNYTAAAAGVAATREDNYYYIRPAVEWKALDWLSVGVFYEYSKDASQGGDSNSFARDRGGLDLAILF